MYGMRSENTSRKDLFKEDFFFKVVCYNYTRIISSYSFHTKSACREDKEMPGIQVVFLLKELEDLGRNTVYQFFSSNEFLDKECNLWKPFVVLVQDVLIWRG